MSAAHSNMGPSGAHRWMTCPGSVKAEEGMPDSESEYAAEGTRAHAYAHLLLDPIGAPDAEADNDEMVSHCMHYVEYVLALGGIQQYEVRVSYDDWVPGGWGTADAIALVGTTLHVIDLKYGKGVEVSPVNNEQGMLYALGAWNAWSMLEDVERVFVHIVQPRMELYREWEITVADLMRFGERARQCATDTTADDAPLVPDEKACKWCKAKATCPALVSKAMEIATLEFGVYEEVQPLPQFSKLTVPQQAYIYKHRKMINDLMSAIEQSITRELQHGGEVPGYKLVEGRTIRKWKNLEEAEAAFRKSTKLKVRDFQKISLISPTQMEKKVGKKHPLMQHATKPPGQPTLVVESDKRQALEIGFGEYNEESN